MQGTKNKVTREMRETQMERVLHLPFCEISKCIGSQHVSPSKGIIFNRQINSQLAAIKCVSIHVNDFRQSHVTHEFYVTGAKKKQPDCKEDLQCYMNKSSNLGDSHIWPHLYKHDSEVVQVDAQQLQARPIHRMISATSIDGQQSFKS